MKSINVKKSMFCWNQYSVNTFSMSLVCQFIINLSKLLQKKKLCKYLKTTMSGRNMDVAKTLVVFHRYRNNLVVDRSSILIFYWNFNASILSAFVFYIQIRNSRSITIRFLKIFKNRNPQNILIKIYGLSLW